jgi:periplasmic divalent cation tolerance protein
VARAADVRLVFVMAANEDEAVAIARALVEEQLAACVNLISPVRSIYRWRGNVEDARECLLLIKTSVRHYAKLEKRVKQLHSYEVPEVIAAPLTHGSADYLKWIGESITPPPAATRSRKPRPRRQSIRPD